MGIYIIVAVLAYLLGSIPFGYLLVRKFRGQDIRASGSGNIGATNVARSAPGLGIATLLLDIGKGFAAVYVARLIAEWRFPDIASNPSRLFVLLGLAALFAILGHVFTVWLKFRGGKGMATFVGVFLAVVPTTMLIVVAIFAMSFAVFRYVSLASIIAAAAFPVVGFLVAKGSPAQPLLPLMCAASLLIIAKHHENIRRLLTGTEHRLELRHRG